MSPRAPADRTGTADAPSPVSPASPTAPSLAPLVVPGPWPTVLDRFDAVVAAFGDRPAVSDDTGTLDYAELDRRSDVVAGRLVPLLAGVVARESPIGVFVGHRASTVVLLLALLKAGHLATVFDPHLPEARLRRIVELSGAAACVVDPEAGLSAGVDASSVTATMSVVVPADELLADLGTPATADGPASGASAGLGVPARTGTPTSPVSIVYTSGSTGRPKGVVQMDGQVMNDSSARQTAFGYAPGDRAVFVLPFSFAAGQSSMFTILQSGAEAWCVDPREVGTAGLLDVMERIEPTVFHSTPHLLRSVTAALDSRADRPSSAGGRPAPAFARVRLVATVGESVLGRDVEAARRHLAPDAVFVNEVGSSEIGILAHFRLPGTSPVPSGVLPAGRVGANKTVRLTDSLGDPVADGEAGEIEVVSDLLSAGYWRDEEQDALRFGRSPAGVRTIRQGDLGRFDENGDLVLLGRSDAAVKVRGYLVEPAEVEAALMTVEELREAVVVPVVVPGEVTRLVAYVVAHETSRPPSAAALRHAVRALVPEYMVPAEVVTMPALPRTERGKVDRQSLPPVPPRPTAAEDLDPYERVVAGIWSTVLGLDDVRLDDDFLALGGDSLSAAEMLAAVHAALGVDLPSTSLVRSPSLREFSRLASGGDRSLPSHPDVVTLRSGSGGPALFCFAGAGALALTFLPVARHLGDHDVYAVQQHALETRGLPDRSVEAAAERALAVLRLIQPRGPYRLVGHSYGGLVALEIASRLRAAGEEVALLALLDTFPPTTTATRADLAFPSLTAHEPEPAASGVLGRVPSAIRAAVDRRVEIVLPDGLPAARQLGERVRARVVGPLRFRGQRQFDAFFDQAGLAARRYRLRPYTGRVLFVVADGNDGAERDWRPVLQGPHTFVDLPSEHSSLLREPHATILAGLLRDHLARAS